MSEVDQVIEQVENAICAEDIWGTLEKESKGTLIAVDNPIFAQARSIWIQLLKVMHPDKVGSGDAVLLSRANRATMHLNELWQECQRKFETGTYGTGIPVADTTKSPVIQTKRYTYTLGRRIHVGGTCGVFNAVITDRGGNSLHGVVKIPHTPVDNDLLKNEADILGVIKQKLIEAKAHDVLAYRFPQLLESVKIKTGLLINTFTLPLEAPDNWASLVQIHKKYTSLKKDGGLRPVVFMMNRLLESLDVAHSLGIIHGQVNPNHVIIHPQTHMGVLLDWTCAKSIELTESGLKRPQLTFLNKDWMPFYPPEFFNRSCAVPVASRLMTKNMDVYGAAMCFLYLIGGNPETMELDYQVAPAFSQWLNRNLQFLQIHRDITGTVARSSFRKAAENVFGPPSWVELSI